MDVIIPEWVLWTLGGVGLVVTLIGAASYILLIYLTDHFDG